jgi:zinc protease
MLGHGELTSRLGRRLRVEEGLSFAMRARVAAQPVHPGHFVFTAMHAPGNADRIEASFRDEFRKVLEEGFHADELEAAKHWWLADRQLSRSEDRVLADLISSNLYFDRDMGWHTELEETVRTLTLGHVNAAVRRHLSLANMTFVRAGDFGAADP